MNRSMGRFGAGAATVAAVTLGAIALNSLGHAQEEQPQHPPMQGERPMPPMEPRGHDMMMHMPPMAGPASMIDDEDNLYVLRGGTVFKVSKRDMRVTGEARLPRPEMGPMMDGPRAGAGFGGRPPRPRQGGRGEGGGGGR